MRLVVCLPLLAACVARPRARAERVPPSGAREVRVAVPTGEAPAEGWPLVVMLHGGRSRARRAERATGFTTLGREAGFAVAYPDGVAHSWADGRGAAVPAQAAGVDDVAWLTDVLDSLGARADIDRSRVVVTGMSSGAMMGWRLLCEGVEMSAFVPVMGGLAEPIAADCTPTGAVAVRVVASPDDPLVPWTGGTVGRSKGRVVPLVAAVQQLQAANQCGENTQTTFYDAIPNDGLRAEHTAWTDCATPLQLTALHGAGHLWPGARQVLPVRRVGRVSPDLPSLGATTAVWDFAREVWGL